MNTHRLLPLLLLATLARADVLPPAQDSSSLKGKLTAATGKATTLPVSATRKGFVLFNLGNLPADVLPTDIANARLRVYFPAAKKPGAIAIHTVEQAWDEKTAALEPGISVSPVAMFPPETVVGKKFVEVDVTATVQAWRAGTALNFGFAFVASGITSVSIGAKEGSGSGYPCELEVQIDRALGVGDGSVGAMQLADGAVTNAKLATPTLTLNVGSGLSGGGSVSLGGNVTLSLGTNLTLGGTTSGTFSGSGAGLTSLDASQLASGTLADARLSGNVPRLNAGTNTFTGTVAATAFVGDGSGLTGIAVSAEPPTNVVPAFGMVWIKPGTFLMGSPASEPGRQSDEVQHAVTLTQGFWMGVHEVTQGEYQAVIGTNPSFFTGDTNRPVEQVSWTQAVAYCTALTTSERTAGRIPAGWGYRLPTEAEWECGCRAGARTTRFSYDDDLSATALGNYAWYTNSGNTTHPVGQKLGNPWGLMDMHGNVFEWCQDYYDAYPAGSATDPQGPASGSFRVIRGGSWGFVADNCRSADRPSRPPAYTDFGLGFRVVLAPGQP